VRAAEGVGVVGRRKTPPPSPLTAEERAELLAEHEAVCWHIARKVRRRSPACDLEDLAAEARTGLVRAARYFDPGRGLKFLSYAYKGAVRLAVMHADREAARGVHVPKYVGRVAFPMESLHREDRNDSGDSWHNEPPDTRTPPVTWPADFWQTATAGLSRRQRAVVVLRVRCGLNWRAIGRCLRCSHETCRIEMHEALRAMRRNVNRDQLEG
jgi:RNA polymerase sigma factor (sigma-70 family)